MWSASLLNLAEVFLAQKSLTIKTSTNYCVPLRESLWNQQLALFPSNILLLTIKCNLDS